MLEVKNLNQNVTIEDIERLSDDNKLNKDIRVSLKEILERINNFSEKDFKEKFTKIENDNNHSLNIYVLFEKIIKGDIDFCKNILIYSLFTDSDRTLFKKISRYNSFRMALNVLEDSYSSFISALIYLTVKDVFKYINYNNNIINEKRFFKFIYNNNLNLTKNEIKKYYGDELWKIYKNNKELSMFYFNSLFMHGSMEEYEHYLDQYFDIKLNYEDKVFFNSINKIGTSHYQFVVLLDMLYKIIPEDKDLSYKFHSIFIEYFDLFNLNKFYDISNFEITSEISNKRFRLLAKEYLNEIFLKKSISLTVKKNRLSKLLNYRNKTNNTLAKIFTDVFQENLDSYPKNIIKICVDMNI